MVPSSIGGVISSIFGSHYLQLLYLLGDLVGIHIFENNSYSLHLSPSKYFSLYLYKTMRCWNSYISFGDNFRDYFVSNIVERDGSKLTGVIDARFLWNESKEIGRAHV